MEGTILHIHLHLHLPFLDLFNCHWFLFVTMRPFSATFSPVLLLASISQVLAAPNATSGESLSPKVQDSSCRCGTAESLTLPHTNLSSSEPVDKCFNCRTLHHAHYTRTSHLRICPRYPRCQRHRRAAGRFLNVPKPRYSCPREPNRRSQSTYRIPCRPSAKHQLRPRVSSHSS